MHRKITGRFPYRANTLAYRRLHLVVRKGVRRYRRESGVDSGQLRVGGGALKIQVLKAQYTRQKEGETTYVESGEPFLRNEVRMTLPEPFGNLPIPGEHVEKPRVKGGRLEEAQRATAE